MPQPTLSRWILSGVCGLGLVSPALLAQPRPATRPAATQRQPGWQCESGRPGEPGAMAPRLFERFRQTLDELKLTDQQQAKINALLDQTRARAKELQQEFEKTQPEVRHRFEQFRELLQQTRRQISEQLDETQRKLFDEKLPAAPPASQPASQPAFGERFREAVEKLDLTDQQKQQVRDLFAQQHQKMQELRQQARTGADQAREQFRQLMQETREKLQSILSDQQLQQLRQSLRQERNYTDPT